MDNVTGILIHKRTSIRLQNCRSKQEEPIKHRIINPKKALNINNAIDFDEHPQSIEIFENKKKYGLTK